MGIFSNIFKGRDAPVDRTAGSSFSFLMGGSTSGKRVNERSAMQMTAVYSCVRILSEAVASLPLQFYRYNESGGKEKAVNHPLYFLLHDEPNPEMTSFVFRETLMTHLLLYGNLYVTFRQGNHILTKQTGDSGFAVSGQVIGVHLAQNETLDMDAGMVEVQVRGIDSGGEAFASEIAMLPVKQVLLEGVIR